MFTIGLEVVAIETKEELVLAAETVPSNLLNLKSNTCASKTLGKTRCTVLAVVGLLMFEA